MLVALATTSWMQPAWLAPVQKLAVSSWPEIESKMLPSICRLPSPSAVSNCWLYNCSSLRSVKRSPPPAAARRTSELAFHSTASGVVVSALRLNGVSRRSPACMPGTSSGTTCAPAPSVYCTWSLYSSPLAAADDSSAAAGSGAATSRRSWANVPSAPMLCFSTDTAPPLDSDGSARSAVIGVASGWTTQPASPSP